MSINTIPLPFIKPTFFDRNGNILANGTIQTYVSGTLTPATTYSNPTGTTSNPNPIVLDASGSAWIFPNASVTYDFYAYDANNNLQWSTPSGGISVGTGILNGVVLLTGNQIVNGAVSFASILAAGKGSITEYQGAALDAVFGAQSENVGGFEIVSSKFSNAVFTTSEGHSGGTLSYDQANAKFLLTIGGSLIASMSNTSVSFPQATTFTANGQAFLTSASVVQIAGGGTGQTTAASALLALTPSTAGNTGNVLMVTASGPQWQSGVGATKMLAAPVAFFNGTQQASWTTVNAAAVAGVPVTATGIFVEAIGWWQGGGPNVFPQNTPPGPAAYACARANTSYGNDTTGGIAYPSSNTFILGAVDLQNYNGIQGSNHKSTSPIPLGINGVANGCFQYIVPTYSGQACWQNLQLRIVGYF